MMGSVRSFVDLLTCLTGLSSFGIFFTGLVVDSTLFIGTRLRPLVTGSRDMLIDSSCDDVVIKGDATDRHDNNKIEVGAW